MVPIIETAKQKLKRVFSFKYILAILAVVLLAIALLFFYFYREKKELLDEEQIRKEKIEMQKNELEAMRQASGNKPLSKEELNRQKDELNKLREQYRQ